MSHVNQNSDLTSVTTLSTKVGSGNNVHSMAISIHVRIIRYEFVVVVKYQFLKRMASVFDINDFFIIIAISITVCLIIRSSHIIPILPIRHRFSNNNAKGLASGEISHFIIQQSTLKTLPYLLVRSSPHSAPFVFGSSLEPSSVGRHQPAERTSLAKLPMPNYPCQTTLIAVNNMAMIEEELYCENYNCIRGTREQKQMNSLTLLVSNGIRATNNLPEE